MLGELLPGDGAEPAELDLMRIDGVDETSVKYIGESLLGYAFFPKGLIGELPDYEGRVRAFVVLEESPEAAAATLEAYTTYLRKEEIALTEVPLAAGKAIQGKDPLYGPMVALQSGARLLGVLGIEDAKAAGSILSKLAAR